MRIKVKVRNIGNSKGVIIPNVVHNILGTDKGDYMWCDFKKLKKKKK